MRTLLIALALAVPVTAAAQAVQPPELKAPGRGSIAGPYGATAFGTGDLLRGSFTLPGPFSAPTDRGPLLASVFPSYSTDHGLSEWGLGWQTQLAITRWRVEGDLDYATDDLSSPWGRLRRGADGSWYPDGMTALVRVTSGPSDTLIAYLPDGTQMTFGGADRVTTPRGTYSWVLATVENAIGQKTILTYDKNSTGRLFLKSVDYGGTGDDTQVRIDFAYEPVQLFTVSYASGAELALDRRVTTVVVSSRNTATAALVERWRYALQYQNDKWSPAFYLSEVDQTFASGSTTPPVRYTYYQEADHLNAANLRPVDKLGPVLAQFYDSVVQPQGGALLDIDNDGRPDLEEAASNTLLRQTDQGFSVEPLAPASATSYYGCRLWPSPMNPPRTLAELRGDDQTQVVDLETGPYVTQTTLNVCDRAGELLSTQVLDGAWTLGPTIRLVDVNRDHRPDLVGIGVGEYDILPNTSTKDGFSFGPVQTGTLDPAFLPNAAWVHDFNGDGLVDLVAAGEASITVWFGTGDGKFTPTGQTFDVLQTDGLAVDLTQLHTQLVDVNRDGLTDLLLTSETSAQVFINNGFYFTAVDIPALTDAFDVDTAEPVVADLAGSGNTEVLITRLGQASSIAVDGPEIGLLETADDGRGNSLTFTYGRAPPAPGERHRASVLTQVMATSAGTDPLLSSYSYALPNMHSVGQFLLGFGQVTKTAAATQSTGTYYFDDDIGGLPLRQVESDSRTPGVQSFSAHQYDAEVFEGIPWMRPKSDQSGWQSTGGSESIADTTDYQAFDADFCPATVVKTNSGGTLTVTRTRASPSGLSQSLSCLFSDEVMQGTHTDSRLDFRQEQQIAYQPNGLVGSVTKLGPLGPLLVSQVSYNPDNTIASVFSPASGTSRFTWDPKTRLLTGVAPPDGSSLTAVRDPVVDAITQLTTTRGSLGYSQYFRYDAEERLQKRWDDLGSASETNPLETLAYRFATATQPAFISVRSLIDTQANSASSEIDLESAAGKSLTSAKLGPDGWAFAPVTTELRTEAESDQWMRPTTTADPATLDLPALQSGNQLVARTHASAFGFATDTLSYLHSDVTRATSTSLSLTGAALVRTEVENGTLSTTQTLDADQRLIAFEDQAHVHYGYTYDALGRLRVATLPDGTTQRRDLDGYGRDSGVWHDGIGGIDYQYDPTTGLPTSARYTGADGKPVRAVSFTYDGIGRKTAERDDDLLRGGNATFSWFYDGATPDTPNGHAEPGLLTGVSGDGFSKSFDYRPDGKLERQTTRLESWRSIEIDPAYTDSGAVRGQTTILRDATGATLSSTDLESQFDAFGRIASMSLNGNHLATLAYDANGNLASAAFADGGQVTFTRDSLTRAPLGFSQTTASFVTNDLIHYNERGLIGSELVSLGNESASRTYGYSPRGFLTSSVDATASDQYDYDPLGLPTSISDPTGARTLSESGGVLTAGSVQYRFDAAGRTIAQGDLELTYGASGQIDTATRGASTWTFKYDEAGQRILKEQGGQPIAAYLGGAYLDASGLVEPVTIGGSVVGVVQAGVFEWVPVDHRGTALGDRDGTARLPTPFGARASQPDLSAALDYVTKGYDADLGTVRMGVRDYDPRISRFWTPDPLLLSDIGLCAKSPVDCNLYSYARNNPALLVDPTGTYEEVVHGALTYQLAIYAGFTERDAAVIALACAGVDHDPLTKPVSARNYLSGVTTSYHFDAEGALDALRTEWKSGANANLYAIGQAMHTLEDAMPGGPHSIGFHTTPSMHGLYWTETGDLSSAISHRSDHAWENPRGYGHELSRVYLLLVKSASSYYGHPVHFNERAAVQSIVKTVLARTDQQIDARIDEVPNGARSSYGDWIQRNSQSTTPFSYWVHWPRAAFDRGQ